MGTYETMNNEPDGITVEGHTGDTDASQPTERSWTGDVSPNQPTSPSAPEGIDTSHNAAQGHAGVGPGPSGSDGPSGTEYGAAEQARPQ